MIENPCQYCGNGVPEAARFCPHCGRPVRQRKTGGLPWIPVAIFVFGLLAVVMALLLARRPAPPAGEALRSTGQAASPPAIEVITAPSARPEVPTPVGSVAATPRPETAIGGARVGSEERVRPRPTMPPISAVFTCSRGAEFNVSPEEAEVFIDGRRIGTADEWDNAGGGKTWIFDRNGTYLVRLVLAGYRTTWIKIVVTPGAEDEIADVDTDLPKVED